jgi:ubiquinone biosynthesis protein COQ9
LRPQCSLDVLETAFALKLFPGEFARTPYGFGLLASFLDGGFLEMLLKLHFAEHAFALELFLEGAERLLNVVIADADLHVVFTTFLSLSCTICAGLARIAKGGGLVYTGQGMEAAMDSENSMEQAKASVLQAATMHVAFDGWSEASFQAAIIDSGVSPALARALFPRGGVDLAVAYHKAGDAAMRAALATRDLAALRFRERVALAIRLRLDGADKELVRRGSALFALPHHAIEGAGLIWGTSDAIWTALGDTSRDLSWYSKRTSLSAVYGTTVLFWLGDTSDRDEATWAFLDRRIENVMQFEKLKAGAQKAPGFQALMKGPLKILERISAPKGAADLPGKMKG